MHIPTDAIIADEKIELYLLRRRVTGDKSRFLASAGFDSSVPQFLTAAIRELASHSEAVEDGINDFGTFYRVEGLLRGPTGRQLAVVAIWIRRNVDGGFRFVTLKPWRPTPI